MTEIYQGWLEDPVARGILEGYKADSFTPGQQEAFEGLVAHFGNMKPKLYRRYMELLSEAIKGPHKVVVNLLVDFRFIVCERDLLWSIEGTDPHVALGEAIPDIL